LNTLKEKGFWALAGRTKTDGTKSPVRRPTVICGSASGAGRCRAVPLNLGRLTR